MPKYSVQNLTVDNVLGYIKNKSIAIPEMQRPFVWENDQIRDLIDSLYNGFPVGYLIIWQNPDTTDKNGERTLGKQIMIDGQQRITALMSALVGQPVLDKKYQFKRRIISFNPYLAAQDEPCFEVQSAAILKDKHWIKDISVLFAPDYDSYTVIDDFCAENEDMDKKVLHKLLSRVVEIKYAPIGVIELNKELKIDQVTEIFIRINSKGTSLTQADFVMSTIAADEKYGGNMLRKAIDYFCHTFEEGHFLETIKYDETFVASPYYDHIAWASKLGDKLFKFSFDDVLRIAFMSQYYRGKMANLTDLLHGRNFEKRTYEDEIMQDTFERLTMGVNDVFNHYIYTQFIDCLRGAGFVHPSLLRSRMTLDFAYMLFIRLYREKMDMTHIFHYVQSWYVMSILTGRYSSSPETRMDEDLRGIREKGFEVYYEQVMANISDTFWQVTLVQKLETSSISAPAFSTFLAAQCKSVDNSFLGDGLKVPNLLNSGDIHHVFPKQYLKDNGHDVVTEYNQVANYALLSKPVNIAIGKKAPSVYLGAILESIEKGEPSDYTNFRSVEALYANLDANALPHELVSMTKDDYSVFLATRRSLMAQKIRKYFESL